VMVADMTILPPSRSAPGSTRAWTGRSSTKGGLVKPLGSGVYWIPALCGTT
jgi:hypothetical protein